MTLVKPSVSVIVHFFHGNSMICSDIWHKYHELYFKIVFTEFGVILKYHEWCLFQISRTIHAVPCLYYNLRNSVI